MTTCFAKTSIRLGALLTILSIVAQHSTAHAAEPLGRLFFTPEKRQALDHQRQQNIQQKPPEEPESRTLTINGIVTRSSGKRTVWVNGVAQHENEMPMRVAVTPNPKDPARIAVTVADSPTQALRVGDTVDSNTGASASVVDKGSIRIYKPRPVNGK